MMVDCLVKLLIKGVKHLENKELSFEEALEQLEEIVKKLEEPDVPIEKAIKYYEKGMELSRSDDTVIKSVKDVKIEDEIEDQVNDGRLSCEVIDKRSETLGE